MKKYWINIIFTSIFFLFAILHLIYPVWSIDYVTILLLIIGGLPWLTHIIKSISLPGGTTIELKDIQKAAEPLVKEEIGRKIEKTLEDEQEYEDIVSSNPDLALVGLRIEIEKRIREIARSYDLFDKNTLSAVIRDLRNNGILTGNVAGSLLELVSLGNRAAHGEPVSNKATNWAIENIPSIMALLDDLIKEK